MRRFCLLFVAVAASCASTQQPQLSNEATTTEVTPTTTVLVETVTTAVPDEARSVATIGVDAQVLELEAVCYAPGAGDLIAVASGQSESGDEVSALVQAVFGEPYVSVRLADRLIESALDDPLVLVADDGVIRGEQIRFVENLDLETGEGDPAGRGFVLVDCQRFESGLPPGYE